MRKFTISALIAFGQVFAVSANTVFISKGMPFAIALSSFTISLLWTLNVKKVAFGNWRDRLIYAGFAMLGCLAGYYFSHWLMTLI